MPEGYPLQKELGRCGEEFIAKFFVKKVNVILSYDQYYIYLFFMNAADRKKVEQSIALLQQVLGQSSSAGGAGVSDIIIPGFEEQVNKFRSIGDSLEPEIKELTNILVQAINRMKAIMNYSSSCKKFDQQQMKTLQQPFMALHQRSEKLEASKNFHYHAKAIKQMLSVFFWVFTDSPDIIMKGAIESADFNAMKFQKNKHQGHNDWYRSIGNSVRILHSFTKAEYKMGLVFDPNGTGNWNDLAKGNVTAPSQSQSHQQSSSQQHSAPQGQKPVAPKKPKKELQTINWIVSNYEKQKIIFAPGEVQMKHGFFIQNCNHCTITIDQKFKSLQMNKCNHMVIIINNCISGVEVMNGEDIQIFVKGSSPSVAIDKCQKVRVVLNQQNMNCQIISSKVSELNLSYESNGNEAKNQMVSEQLITRWNPNKKKYETAVYDKFL